MKGKYIVIFILLLVLAFSVYKMLKVEERIRQERIHKEFVEDETKPLIESIEQDELERIALNSDYYFWARGDYFCHLNYSSRMPKPEWDSIFLAGVNIGVALPGYFPGDFAMTYDDYYTWFEMIGRMNSNVVRVYTILPPEFYDAFAQYNLKNHKNPLYLIQGIWANIPNNLNYFDRRYNRYLKKEIIDAVDVLHGNAVIKKRPGHASGVYASDVSEYVAAILFGREWEPNAVFSTILENSVSSYSGNFVSVNQGNPMEVWLASMLDYIVLYETQYYSMQHPVSFVNWLPLDPMYHNTEIVVENVIKEFDNDLNTVDITRFHNTPLFIPGLFASYHAYPYYPDYIYMEPRYRNGKDQSGKADNFYAYLEHLKEFHKGIPLLISEYGVPSSRGNSHVSPFGMDQGGHSEADHASINLQLTRDIFNTFCAGAVFFEWMDEWFKHNWLVMDFEVPHEKIKDWHNMENPEQNFGILAMENKKISLDDDYSDWEADIEPLKIITDSDPTYLYMLIRFDEFDFAQNNFYLAFDVLDPRRGDFRLPFINKKFDYGFEFLGEFFHTDSARFLVDETYSLQKHSMIGAEGVYAPKPNENGLFVEQLFIANRERESILGDSFPAYYFNRSLLQHGNTTLPENSNADWFWDEKTKTLQIRFTWHMLNVSSPSDYFLIDDEEGTLAIEYSVSDEFNVFAFITDKNNELIAQLPGESPARISWEDWKIPDYSYRLKPVYDTLKEYFYSLNHAELLSPEKIEKKSEPFICPFYNNAEGVVSISFGEMGYSQYETAYDILRMYGVNATLSVDPSLMKKTSAVLKTDAAGRRRRMTSQELFEFVKLGNEIALQTKGESIENVSLALNFLSRKMNTPIKTLHYNEGTTISNPTSIIYSRPYTTNKIEEVSYRNIPASVIFAPEYSPRELWLLMKERKNSWTILQYRYFLGEMDDYASNQGSNLFINHILFQKHIRLIRNQSLWMATEKDAYTYLKERNNSIIKVNSYNDLVFISIENDLNKQLYNHPLTLCYPTDASFVEISGSESDGMYKNREGCIYFNLKPGKEAIIKLLY